MWKNYLVLTPSTVPPLLKYSFLNSSSSIFSRGSNSSIRSLSPELSASANILGKSCTFSCNPGWNNEIEYNYLFKKDTQLKLVVYWIHYFTGYYIMKVIRHLNYVSKPLQTWGEPLLPYTKYVFFFMVQKLTKMLVV